MSYRDDDAAREARLLALERTAADADELRARLHASEERNRQLEARLATFEPPARPRRDGPRVPLMSWPAAVPVPRLEPPPRPRPVDLEDPRLAVAEATAEWATAAELLLELAADGPTARQLAAWLRLGEVAETELADHFQADLAYEQVLELDPGHAYARHRRIALFEATEQWFSHASALQQWIDHLGDQPAAVPLLLVRAHTLLEQLADQDAAAAAASRARALSPGDPIATAVLEAIARGG